MMKKKTAAAAALLLSLSLLCSCSPKLTERDGKLIDSKSGITYVAAPLCFEPSHIDDELFGECKELGLELYPVTGQPTELYISEKYEGIGGIWYAEGEVEMPTLEEFGAERVYICVETMITTAIAQIADREDIDAIIDVFINGEVCSSPNDGKGYKLKFESPDYAGIFYNLLYITGDETNYIYDRSTKRCVDAGLLLEKYLPTGKEQEQLEKELAASAAAAGGDTVEAEE